MYSIDFYYFSPTGGTKKAGELFCKAISQNICAHDLLKRDFKAENLNCDIAVIAAPVFGGRIPALCAEKLNTIDGAGKSAVVLAVYGNRAYDDALLEMADIANERGFKVIAGAALNAQHSMVAAVGAGRPDSTDAASIAAFAEKVIKKIDDNDYSTVSVPGNKPYKSGMGGTQIPPVSNSGCVKCGACERLCPAGAITIENGEVKTDAEKCILCLACIAVCPKKVRNLRPEHQERLNGFLMPLAAKRSENEYFI